MDDLDRRIAAALQLDGRAGWHRIARAVGSSGSTVSRRTQRMLKSGQLRVAAVADPVRCGFGYPVLMQVKCEVGASPVVAQALARRPDVRFVTLVTGSFDIVMEIIVSSRGYLASVLFEALPKIEGIKDTTADTVLRNFKMSYEWSRELLGETDLGPANRPSSLTEEPYATCTLDAMDLELHDLLQEDGRRSYSDLAFAAGISESMARRRVESLRERGCLRIATLIEPYLLGYDVECFCWIRVDLSRLEEAARILSERREIRYLSATIGHSDLICEVILRSQGELYDFSTQVLGQLPGLQSIEIGLELQSVKRIYLHVGESADAGSRKVTRRLSATRPDPTLEGAS